MSSLKLGVLTFGYYQPRLSKLDPKFQDIFVKAYMGYSRQLVYTYLSMVLGIFAAIAFFTINITFSFFLLVMTIFVVVFGVLLIQFYSSNLEHLLQSLEDRGYTPDYSYKEDTKNKKQGR